MTLFVGLVFSCSCKATAGEVDTMGLQLLWSVYEFLALKCESLNRGQNWYEAAYDFLVCKCKSLNLSFFSLFSNFHQNPVICLIWWNSFISIISGNYF